MIVCFNISCVSRYLWLNAFSLGDFYTLLLRQPYAAADTRLLKKARVKSFGIEMNPLFFAWHFHPF